MRFLQLLVNATLFMPFLFIFDSSWVTEPSNIATILYLGFMTTSVAYILYLTGLQKVPSSSAVMLSLGVSVFIVWEVLSAASWRTSSARRDCCSNFYWEKKSKENRINARCLCN